MVILCSRALFDQTMTLKNTQLALAWNCVFCFGGGNSQYVLETKEREKNILSNLATIAIMHANTEIEAKMQWVKTSALPS